MAIKSRTISFGKVAYTGKFKSYLATVTITLKGTPKGETLSVTGDIWNTTHTDIVCGGQCIDTLNSFLRGNKLWQEVRYLWRTYHLNDMHAGTRVQEDYLHDMYPDLKFATDYDKCCEALKQANLYVDEGIKFGHTWHFWPIPPEDIERIERLIGVKNDN